MHRHARHCNVKRHAAATSPRTRGRDEPGKWENKEAPSSETFEIIEEKGR